jgi:hypothetical protein
LASHQISGGSETIGPSPWEDLRPRVYKAVRAAAMGLETSQARRELLERWLSTLFQQDAREITFPEELAEAQQTFFQAGLKRAVNRCRQYAGAWFARDSLGPENLIREVQQAVSQVAQEDEIALVLINRDDFKAEEVPRLLKYRLRQRWCGDANAPDIFRVEEWLKDVAFFNRESMEIGSWARLFHTIALLHREGLKIPELRRKALRSVQEQVINGQPLESLSDLVIYLEERVRAGEYETSGDSVAPTLEPGLFPGGEPKNVCLLLRIGLVFLVTAGQRPEQQQRLAWLEKHQDLNDLRDLLLLFLAVVQGQDPLPPPSEVLDLLQRQGYPIQHQDFSDEYRAFLVPLEDLPGVLEVTLSWPLDPAALTGDPRKDLNLARDQEERRRLRLQAFKEEALAFCQGRENPLPYAEFIRPAARFVVVWLAAQQYRGEKPLDPPAQVQEAVKLLSPALLKLIRPRKGYELTHRSQLEQLLWQEFQAYQQAVSRCCRFGGIANEDDDGRFCHMAAALALAQRQSDLEALLPEEVLGLEMAEVLGILKELAATFSLDLEPGAAPRWHEFKDWLKGKVDWPSLVGGADDPGRLPANWKSGADTLLQELASQLYRLVVAKARAERGLTPLIGDQALLTWLAAWLTPEKQALLKASSRQLLNAIKEQARRAAWESYPLVVESREELVVLIKYYLALELKGRDLETYSRAHRVGALPQKVAARLTRCHIPPEIAGPGGSAAVIQEVLRPRAPEAIEAQRQLEEEVLALLPRTDCGSCGSLGCLAFARLLLQGRAQPTHCLTSPAALKVRLAEILTQAPAVAPEPYVLLPEDIRLLTSLLDPYFVALRHRVAQELDSGERGKIIPFKKREISILQIGKSPDAVTFHRYLEDYLGYDAANRLTRADHAFLAEYGELRLVAEVRELEDFFSWLAYETGARLSKFALAEKDLARRATENYGRCFFLSDLSETDRTRVQEFRRQRFLFDFLEDWEQSLTELWQVESRIEDWKDFSRIVAKSYWHQEFTPAPIEILRELGAASRKLLPEWGISLGERLVQEQLLALESRSHRLIELLRGRQVTIPADMEFLVRGFVKRAWQELATAPPVRGLSSPNPVFQLTKTAFNQLDQANLYIPGGLRIHWDELSWRVREILGSDAKVAPEELAHLQGSATGLTWREMSTLGIAWIKAQIEAEAEHFLMDQVEVDRFLNGDLPSLSPNTLCRAVRRLYLAGKKSFPDLMEALHATMNAYPQGWPALGEAALVQLIWGRLATGRFRFTEPDADSLVRTVDRVLRARVRKDVPKLKAYMFLLARMESNLDKLTALLREIRETSDIIEAAWLDFTKERTAQPRSPNSVAAEGSKVPLLLARLDPAKLNRYLEEGIPRGEPREYTMAYWELITILEFYVVSAAPQDSPQEIFRRLQSSCYDLSGLSRKSLFKTLKALYQQRDRLLPRKISICTYVLGHRLASTQPQLAHNEAAFLKEKNAFLKTETLPVELHKGQLAGKWGVELGKVRNELYLQISDLLQEERTESFASRIGQIIERLEEEYAATLAAFQKGELNRLTAFYIFRRFQKDQGELSGADLGRFLQRHQPETLAQLRSRLAPTVVAEVDRQLEKILSRYRGALLG